MYHMEIRQLNGWWSRLYSHTLSRPQMVRGDIGDVARPWSSEGGGRKHSFLMGRSVMVQLAELVGEILDKVSRAPAKLHLHH